MFHGTTAALIKHNEARGAKCSCLLYQSFLEKKSLVCLQSQDKAHRRFKRERGLLRAFFRFSFILKKWCKWHNKWATVFLSIAHPMLFPQSSEDLKCKCWAMFQKQHAVYFLWMGLSPVLHVTCDPLFPFMASNQRECRPLIRNNPFCKWTSE